MSKYNLKWWEYPSNIRVTISRDLTPCLVIVPFLTAIWGIQPSSITIIKRVDPITALSLVRRRIKANVYCNQCYWHEFIINHLASRSSSTFYNQSLNIFFPGNIFRWTRLYLQYCICPSCAKISSNCLIESGGARLKVNNCTTFISMLQWVLQGLTWLLTLLPDMKSSGGLQWHLIPRAAPRPGLQTSAGAPGEVKTRDLIIREWGGTLHCITLHYRHNTLHYRHITITFVRKIARLII